MSILGSIVSDQRVCRLARSKKLDYAGPVASGVFPPTRYLLFQLRIKFL
jgi:hypothetical protein